jgi:prepilin-type processing-associated H-X9-DG protein
VELLVALAVLALLAALLFPVFAQAREKARQTTCAAHLKNLGTAVLIYMQDYDERFPLAAYAVSSFDFVTWHDLIDPYLRNKAVWRCPSSSVGLTDAGGKATTHYGYNARYLTTIRLDFANVTAQEAHSLAQAAHPTETVLLTDARASLTPSWCGDDGKFLLPPSEPNTHCWGRPNFLHQEGSNIAWLDGHLKWARADGFYASQTPLDRCFDLR